MESILTSTSTGSVQSDAIGVIDDALGRWVPQSAWLTRFSEIEHNLLQSYTGNLMPESDWYDLRETADAIFEIEGTLIKLAPKSAIVSSVSTIFSETWYYSQKTTDVTSEVERTLTRLQQNQQVAIPRSAEIRDYLLLYPDMTSRLPIVCQIARFYLESRPQLSLELYRDPEIDDSYLTLYVRQKDYNEALLNEIETLSEACNSVLKDSSGWLLITTDFRPRSNGPCHLNGKNTLR